MNRVARLMAMAVVVLVCAVGAQAGVTIETVLVGNPGNAGELSGAGGSNPYRICGAVNYVYRIGKFEITAGQYTAFLNAVADEDTYGLYNEDMADPIQWTFGCNIQRTGSSPNYSYSVAAEWADRPVNYVSWGDAARFCNWVHNGQPVGAQDLSTTEDGSYYLNGATSNDALMAVVREPDATWVIPSEDEWYKAAYHKNDGVTGNYYDYPTQSDTAPTTEAPPGTDMTNGSANYFVTGYVDPTYYRTEVGAYDGKPSDSPYGTFDQSGNVFEWNEALLGGSNRGLRGGAFDYGVDSLPAANRGYFYWPTLENYFLGFRVAVVGDTDSDGILDVFDNCPTVANANQSNLDGDSFGDACDPCPFDPSNTQVEGQCIPTLSEWGMVAMAALMLAAGAVVVSRRRAAG